MENKNFVPARLSLGQQVVEYLRESIYRAEIPPGTYLNAVDIAHQLGVSRSPVRDALLTLAGEGIVEPAVGSGYQVIQFDEKFIQDVFTVRIALETVALRQSINRFELTYVNSQFDFWSGVAAGNFSWAEFHETYLQADAKFHETIVENSQNRLLYEVLDKVIRVGIAIRHWQHKRLFIPEEIVTTAKEHIAILDAIKLGETDQAVAALTLHIENSQHRALSRFEPPLPTQDNDEESELKKGGAPE